MKILHTSDLHIKSMEDERWETLEMIKDTAVGEGVELFIISGDFFDSKNAYREIYPSLRSLFENEPFTVLILPGNHDSDAYDEREFLGENVKIIRESGESFIFDNVEIFGLPYRSISKKELRAKLLECEEKRSEDKMSILLYHGELLDFSYSKDVYGGESPGYMGVRLSQFENLGFQYILAGHFHSNFAIYEFIEGKFFVYPGSPISITKKETGKRFVNIFETGEFPEKYPLQSPYFLKREFKIGPGLEPEKLREIEDAVYEKPEIAKLFIEVTGFTEMEEEEFHHRIKDIEKIQDDVHIENRVRDVSQVLSDELYITFMEKLEKKDENTEKVRDLFLRTMVEVIE